MDILLFILDLFIVLLGIIGTKYPFCGLVGFIMSIGVLIPNFTLITSDNFSIALTVISIVICIMFTIIGISERWKG